MAPTETVKKSVKKDAKKSNRLKNYDLGCGIMRYSHSRNFKRKALYRFKGTKTRKATKPKVAITVTKKIGGANNGGERVVKLQKPKAYYPTKPRVQKRPARRLFKNHQRKTRKSMVPGRVLILLAGRHQAKRVVLLKVLSSGLLLVTGPYFLNGCPMRRISQRYVIATKTVVDLGKFKLPEHVNDKYFKRAAKKKSRRTEGDIFAQKKEQYVPSEQRKEDQKAVDTAVKQALRKRKDRNLICQYLKALFRLKSSQYPHRMKF
ncbi:large ribosomal subunit protein eL6-like [Phlebotomus argentipes]|uniref:large ribosomal subunit protein eL6-like n=1 Tax=Phlebotomus argentipes TaxID=94469 RepID=UPI00289332BB|nr:large ribosomal subunit protein eL6-like [Phlebotomus argentipes]